MQRARGRSVSLLPLLLLGPGIPPVQSPQRWQADIQIRTLEVTFTGLWYPDAKTSTTVTVVVQL